MDPKIINNTCYTEENDTTTCIEGNPHDVDSMATNCSLTAGGVENHCFELQGGQFPSKFDIAIPKTPFYEGMVV